MAGVTIAIHSLKSCTSPLRYRTVGVPDPEGGRVADEGMTPQEVGQDLYYLLKYGDIPGKQPKRRTETKRYIRRTPDGLVEIFEHEVIDET